MRFSTFIHKQKRATVFLYALLTCTFVVLSLRGVVMYPDSEGYIHASIYRSCLYPSLIGAFLYISSAHGLFLLVLFQLAFGYVAIIKTVHTLQRLFQYRDYLRWFLVALLIVPYIGGFLGNCILTEAIAYPLFMLAMCSLLDGIRYRRLKDFLVFLVYVALLVLTRRQFLFLYVLFVFVIGWLFFSKARVRKDMLFIGLILSVLTSTYLEKSYHLLVNHRFVVSPMGGMHFFIAPMYLSGMQDSTLFADTLQRAVFVETHRAMDENKLVPEQGDLFYPYAYALSFDRILHDHLLPILGKHDCPDPLQRDQMLTTMGLTLIRRHAGDYLHLYANNIIYYFGGYFYCALIGVFLLYSLYQTIRNPAEFFNVSSLVILMTAFANITAVCLFIFVQKRYSIYTDAFLTMLILILIDRSIFAGKLKINKENVQQPSNKEL